MKKVYGKPSMAMNSFKTADNTNSINVLSSVAQTKGSSKATMYGMSIIDGTKLHK